jgi:hypothetical protein
MALPKIDVPIFKVKLPITKKTISCRPFLVKEEKILLMAKESGDNSDDSVNAIRQVVNNCILDDDIDVDTIPLIDLEFVLLKIRAKSMGEIITSKYRHGECTKPTEINIDLNTVEVVLDPKNKTKIKINDIIGVIIIYPTINLMAKMADTKKNPDKIFEIIVNCIDSIFDTDDVYSPTDYTNDELNEFLLGMTQKQFGAIEEFFSTLPKLQKKVKFECIECGHKEDITLEGLSSFFD